MSPYPVLCYTPGCGRPAVYKIAARWSDGITGELKTYSLCCADCLPDSFRRAIQKHGACRRAPGETLEAPGIFRLERGARDQQLQRLTELEEQFRAG
jgi:hypothetical protein